MINIQSLQGACRLDSAVLYGTLRETMEMNSHNKKHIVLSPLTEIDDQLGRNYLSSSLYGRPDDTENLCLCFSTCYGFKIHFLFR